MPAPMSQDLRTCAAVPPNIPVASSQLQIQVPAPAMYVKPYILLQELLGLRKLSLTCAPFRSYVRRRTRVANRNGSSVGISIRMMRASYGPDGRFPRMWLTTD